jgi:hypothetical protein
MIADNKKIVWLASYPKSGNTWFRVLLANLFANEDHPININELNKTILASSRQLFDKVLGIDSSDLTSSEIFELRPKMYREMAQKSNSILYIKVHDAWTCTESSLPLFPSDITKGVIYLVRHPLDIAVSYAYHSKTSLLKSLENIDNPKNSMCNREDKLYHQLEQKLGSWAEHVVSWIDESNLPIHIIRYEDMLQDTLNEFKDALNFLEIDYDEHTLKKAVRFSRFETLKKQEEEYSFREKPINLKSFFRTGTSGSWKKHYEMQQLQSFINKNEQLLIRFGYSL